MTEPTLYITLAESQEELKAVALSHGFDISKVEIFEVKPPELEQSASDQYTVFHPSEVELVDVMQNILRKLEQTKAGRIDKDAIGFIQGSGNAIARLLQDIIDRHQGLIQVRNHHRPRGAVFSIWIPEKPAGSNGELFQKG